MSKFILFWFVQYIMLHGFIKQLTFILFFDQCIFLYSKCMHLSVAVQVWPQAAFRQHPFLVADLPQQPDIGDLYRYIYLHDINYKDDT